MLSRLGRPVASAATAVAAAATRRHGIMVRNKGGFRMMTATTTTGSLQTETLPTTSIPVVRSVQAIRQWRSQRTSPSIGLVPTMGALHDGHLALIRAAARENDEVVVSVFLNPAQFGAGEDLASYPVTWETDAKALARTDQQLSREADARGRISVVFAPDTHTMYPEGRAGQQNPSSTDDGTFVTLNPLSRRLEGASRPTFFRGVATICTKLFNLVRPTRVYLGQKDVQQTVVVRRMVRDLMIPLDVVVCPTQRDPDGLALSSRNVYLGPRRRAVAVKLLPCALAAARRAYERDLRKARSDILAAADVVVANLDLAQRALSPRQRALFELDYLSLADPDTLDEVDIVDDAKGAVLSAAVKMLPLEDVCEGEDVGYAGGPVVRLIDNVILRPTA
ncbi:hypothetical protein XA68_14206 [Ophiocordyceps unilateralis]|uniref:Pantoate--beta-alanine ligase n=1 Tax=Ophiocordyceps unilateralis TaxID=268505 RepID=A0A2A9PB31_OPHUN|nr:hypothetical protein XA68_14206 [Ophiocordyceps unilateralis]